MHVGVGDPGPVFLAGAAGQSWEGRPLGLAERVRTHWARGWRVDEGGWRRPAGGIGEGYGRWGAEVAWS